LKGAITIVTIAHRPSMIAFADHVIGVEEGRIVEHGAYQTLIQAPQSYLSRLVLAERADSTGVRQEGPYREHRPAL